MQTTFFIDINEFLSDLVRSERFGKGKVKVFQEAVNHAAAILRICTKMLSTRELPAGDTHELNTIVLGEFRKALNNCSNPWDSTSAQTPFVGAFGWPSNRRVASSSSSSSSAVKNKRTRVPTLSESVSNVLKVLFDSGVEAGESVKTTQSSSTTSSSCTALSAQVPQADSFPIACSRLFGKVGDDSAADADESNGRAGSTTVNHSAAAERSAPVVDQFWRLNTSGITREQPVPSRRGVVKVGPGLFRAKVTVFGRKIDLANVFFKEEEAARYYKFAVVYTQ